MTRDQVLAREQVLEQLLRAHRAYFDVEEGHVFAGRAFPGYAEFHAHGEQYVLAKRAKLWEADAHQYLFFDTCERLDAGLLESLVRFMQEEAIAKVVPQPNHMSSDLCLVVVADEVDAEAARILERTRFRKNFKLGLQGWSDLKLAAIDLAGNRVVTNRAGREMGPTLETHAWPQQAASRKGRSSRFGFWGRLCAGARATAGEVRP